ncbi:MAG TPA: periplasmic heavy metal sensor [Casimicrobiaceae bacterium]|nr:periplasmic heavy metal sensor [Casimicrobiaceae bacterium]
MIMKQSYAARLAALAAVAVIGASGSALAQPAHFGHGGHAGGDVALAIAALKGQLNLNTSQQQMWDNAAASMRAAHQSARANMQQVHATLAAELAKAEPDLAAVAAAGDDARARNAALHRQVRDSWLALYATFTPDQKAIVRDALSRRLARMEQIRQRHLGGAPHG